MLPRLVSVDVFPVMSLAQLLERLVARLFLRLLDFVYEVFLETRLVDPLIHQYFLNIAGSANLKKGDAYQ